MPRRYPAYPTLRQSHVLEIKDGYKPQYVDVWAWQKARGFSQGVWGLNQKSSNSISKNKDRVLTVRKEFDVQGLISREYFAKKADDHLTEVMVKPAIKRAPMMDVFSFFSPMSVLTMWYDPWKIYKTVNSHVRYSHIFQSGLYLCESTSIQKI